VAVHLRRPRPADLTRLRTAATTWPLTYGPTGATIGAVGAGAGLHRRTWSTPIPPGADQLLSRLLTWDVHRGAGLLVDAEADVAPGVTVALAAPLPVGWIAMACRVVAVVDQADVAGFAYGTLPGHPEQGEEAFLVRRGDPSTFEVVALSRPAHPAARAVPPVAAMLQSRACDRYLEAARRLASDGGPERPPRRARTRVVPPGRRRPGGR
jgi:uncharacterized protein (UPF0548 family)